MQAVMALLLSLLAMPGATAFSTSVFEILRRMQREGLPLPPPFDNWNATMQLPWVNNTIKGFAHARSMMALSDGPTDPCELNMQPSAPQAPATYCQYLSDCTSCTNKCTAVPPSPTGEGNLKDFMMQKVMFEATLCRAIGELSTLTLAPSPAGAGSVTLHRTPEYEVVWIPSKCPSAADLDATLAAIPGGYPTFESHVESTASFPFGSGPSPELPFNNTATLKAYSADKCVTNPDAGMDADGCLSKNMKKAMEVEGCDQDNTESDLSPDCAAPTTETLDLTDPCTKQLQQMMGLTDAQMHAFIDAGKKMYDGCSAQSTAATCDAYDGSKIVQELKDAQVPLEVEVPLDAASPITVGALVIATLLAVSLVAMI